MKKRIVVVCLVSGLAVLATLLGIMSRADLVRAAAPPVATQGPKAQDASAIEYLIPLPFPAAETLSVPAGLSPEQAAEYARNLTYQQAQPILAELQRLRIEGEIAGFEVRPDLHAVAVQAVPGFDASSVVGRLSSRGFVASVGEQMPACVTGATEALTNQVYGLSQVSLHSTPHGIVSGLSVQATNPSIDVYVPPGTPSHLTWTYVTGSTTPTTTVTMRLLRGGSVVGTATVTSTGTGNYYIYPTYQFCPSASRNWVIRVGDVVEVTAGGNTVSTTVVEVSAWVDPVANTVAGNTAAGRSVETVVYHYASDLCSTTTYTQTVSASGSGAFSANFTSLVDFNRRASAKASARDSNGNSTFYWFYAYRISANFNSDLFWGFLKPDVDFTARLSRTGSIVSSRSGRSDATGYYYGYFGPIIQSGDVISVSGGGVSMQYTATDLGVTLSPATNQATGTSGAGRRVQAYFYKNGGGWPIPTACSWSFSCVSATADGSGNFTLNAGMDLVRGDYAYFYVYDAEGNYQYGRRHNIPAISAHLTWNEVSGFWINPDDYLTIVLKDSSGMVKGTDNRYPFSWDYSFHAYPGTLLPTDKIEVGNGIVTETMTVQNLTARLDGGTGNLTGSAPNGHLLAQLYDFRRDSGFWWSYCSETTVSSGSYNLTFSGAQPSARDDAYEWSTGPDGHYTSRYASAFTVNAQKGDDYVWGYSETPNTPVTITLKAGATTKAVNTTTSFSDGYFYAFLSSGTPVTIIQGDTLQLQTGDGDIASLSIPELTVNTDATNNRLYGRSPAGQPVQPYLRRRYNLGWWAYSRQTTADGSGNYSASFSGLYWSRDCSTVQVGHHCGQPAVYYYDAASHLVWLERPPPAPVAADSFESDDTRTTARAYTGIQHHTFHTPTDSDWISFAVSAADVTNNVPYRIETFNMGWGMATRVRLYHTDGTTLLLDITGYENRGRGVSTSWTFGAAGTYYLQISPPSSSYAAYCDAMYDVMVLPVRAKIHLPVVIRNY